MSLARKILILQPDSRQRLRLLQMLQEMGHDCEGCEGGEEALDLFKTIPYDMVVCELTLPGIDGFQFLTELRKKVPVEQCAALVLTAFPSLMSNALRMKKPLGIASVLSLKSTAVTLTGIFDSVLAGMPKKRQLVAAAPRVNLPPSDKPLLILPADAFQKMAKEKEAKRLARITALRLGTDRPLDESLQSLVQETAAAFEYPVCLLTLDMGERHYFKFSASIGRRAQDDDFGADWTQLAPLLEEKHSKPIQAPDARKHPDLEILPLVSEKHVGCYFSAPISTGEGKVIGTLALVDAQAHQMMVQELDLFVAVARRVGGEVELALHLQNLRKDLSQQSSQAQEASDRLDMLKEVLESLQLGVLLQDSHGQVVLANSRLQELTGLERADMQGANTRQFHDQMLSLFDDPDSYMSKITVLEDGPYLANEVFETQRPQRQVLRWTARPFHVGDGWFQLHTYEDITASVDLAAQRERLVSIDFVTGLLNRRGVEEEAAREAERARRKKRQYSLVLFYLHGLDELNQAKSWAAGDAALKAVGERIQASLRLMDRPARWSGRHFLIILPETNEADARMVAGRMAVSISKLQAAVPLYVSGGVAYSEDSSSLPACLTVAEQRLALARSSQPGQVL